MWHLLICDNTFFLISLFKMRHVIKRICYVMLYHWRTEARSSPKFHLVRLVSQTAEGVSPVFVTPFPYIPVYIVTYDVILWSGPVLHQVLWRHTRFLPMNAWVVRLSASTSNLCVYANLRTVETHLYLPQRSNKLPSQTGKVNVGIFSCAVDFLYSKTRVTRWFLCHSDFTKFNYRWGSLRHPSPHSPSLSAPSASHNNEYFWSSSLSKIRLESLLLCLLSSIAA